MTPFLASGSAPSRDGAARPQSQRVEPKTSPVKHSEWTRDEDRLVRLRVPHDERDVGAVFEPVWNAWIVHAPRSVGSVGDATRVTRRSVRIR